MAIYQKCSKEFLKNIQGVSYIGRPKDKTMMFLTKKIENNLSHLSDVKDCLVFVEDTIEISMDLRERHMFVACKNPSLAYAEEAICLMGSIETEYRKKKYSKKYGGLIGENVTLGDDVYIEPNVFIDHDVQIGNGVVIKTGTIIRRNIRIGDNCILNENCMIGEPAFNIVTMANGERVEIPSFGGITIGSRVYLGAGTVVSRGSADDTVIEDDVKVAALVHIGHDVHLGQGAELRAGCTISGYCDVGEASVVAMNATVKNRIKLGDHCMVGMGSVVIADVAPGTTVFGSPAARIL